MLLTPTAPPPKSNFVGTPNSCTSEQSEKSEKSTASTNSLVSRYGYDLHRDCAGEHLEAASLVDHASANLLG